MKKTVTLALAFALVLGLLSGCANADKPADTAENSPAEETQSPAASTENFLVAAVVSSQISSAPQDGQE